MLQRYFANLKMVLFDCVVVSESCGISDFCEILKFCRLNKVRGDLGQNRDLSKVVSCSVSVEDSFSFSKTIQGGFF